MDLSEKIEQFKKENPQVSEEKIDQLIKDIAYSCMQSIVKNQEFNGRGENAWWTIKDTFEVDIKDESEMLIENRINKDVQSSFEKACRDEDIKGIKKGLENFASINQDGDNSVLTYAASVGNLKIIKFFLEDDFIQKNYRYKKMLDFDNWKGTIFQKAFIFEQKEVLEYLINQHNLESTPEAKEALNWEDNSSKEMKKAVISMIEKKYLDFMIGLDSNKTNQVKMKI
jgi:hypothetical protein